jgi:hypothetical protein
MPCTHLFNLLDKQISRQSYQRLLHQPNKSKQKYVMAANEKLILNIFLYRPNCSIHQLKHSIKVNIDFLKTKIFQDNFQ